MRSITKEDFDNLHIEDNYIGVKFHSGTRKVLTKVGANEYAFINFELMDINTTPIKHSSMVTALDKVKSELCGAFIFNSAEDLYEFLLNR